MTLTSPTTVRMALQRIGVRPSKALGQNFLVDRNILNILVEAAAVNPDEGVAEFGAGLGVLTEELARLAARVLVVEKDHRLFAHLQETFGSTPGLELVCGDALDVDMNDLPGRGYAIVVANLPYVAGSRILVNLARAATPPDRVVVTVQREVADRLTAAPDSDAFGMLSLWVQMTYRAEVVRNVKPTCFWPQPAVMSSIVRLVRIATPRPWAAGSRELFYALSRYAFMHRRKQLAALLAQSIDRPVRTASEWQSALVEVGLDPQVRPEALGPDAWVALVCGPLAGAQTKISC